MTVRVDWRQGLSLVGTVLKWLWVPLSLPLVIAVSDGTPVVPFLVPIAGSAALGFGLERLAAERELRAREAFLVVGLT